MRKLVRNRRGSVAFATVVALVPLIGAMALGAEAASWYVTRQHAQTAADAAAYSGALTLACTFGSSCADTGTVVDRGKQFAARNSFCQAGESLTGCSTPPSGTTQSVAVQQLATWNGNPGNYVQATVGQTQPANLARVLGWTTVNIAAVAVAQVVLVTNPCVVSLQNPLFFQGNTTVNTSTCGIASNSTAANSIDLTGNSINVSNLGSVAGQGGCDETAGNRCAGVITYAPPVPNPLSGLNAPMASLTTTAATFPDGKCSGSAPVAYTAATRCYNDKLSIGSVNLNGVYFFAGKTTIAGASTTITGTATLIMLPGATLDINGGPTINLTAPTTIAASQVPTALQGSTTLTLMSKLLLYISETTSDSPIKYVTIQGSTSSSFNGVIYSPNASVAYSGNAVSGGCNMVIAKGIQLSGNSTFDNSGCPETSKSKIHVVKMVQ